MVRPGPAGGNPGWFPLLPAGLVLALLGGGCDSPAEEAGSRALLELERLAFVPAAKGQIEGFAGRHSDCSLEEALVFDLFEVTRADGKYYGLELGDTAFSGSERNHLRWPLALDWNGACSLAVRRGMRLPTAREWLHVATVGGVQKYPWHSLLPYAGVANIEELGLGRPIPVGSFERGRVSRFGCYDMMGNVWEWVSDVIPGYGEEVFGPALTDPATGRPQEASVLGGGFDTVRRPLYGEHIRPYDGTPRLRIFARRLPVTHRALDVGARMCADAESYLWAKATEWGTDADARRRVTATGARWADSVGPEVVGAFLDGLAERPGAPEALAWLAEGARR